MIPSLEELLKENEIINNSAHGELKQHHKALAHFDLDGLLLRFEEFEKPIETRAYTAHEMDELVLHAVEVADGYRQCKIPMRLADKKAERISQAAEWYKLQLPRLMKESYASFKRLQLKNREAALKYAEAFSDYSHIGERYGIKLWFHNSKLKNSTAYIAECEREKHETVQRLATSLNKDISLLKRLAKEEDIDGLRELSARHEEYRDHPELSAAFKEYDSLYVGGKRIVHEHDEARERELRALQIEKYEQAIAQMRSRCRKLSDEKAVSEKEATEYAKRIGALEADIGNLRSENTAYQRSGAELKGRINEAEQKLAQARADAQKLDIELQSAASVGDRSMQNAQKKEREYAAEIKKYEQTVEVLKDGYGKLDASYQRSLADIQARLDQAEQKLKKADADTHTLSERLKQSEKAASGKPEISVPKAIDLNEFSLSLYIDGLGLPHNTDYFELGHILRGEVGDSWLQRFERLRTYLTQIDPMAQQEDKEYVLRIRNGLEKVLQTSYVKHDLSVARNAKEVVDRMFSQIDAYITSCEKLAA